MKLSFKKIVSMLLLVASSICVMNDRVSAHVRVKHIARLKGQEEVTIQGLGLVTGLNGTGDGASFAPTLKGLASALQRLNGPALDSLKDIKDAKNVALVMVTATIPAAGARQGDQIEVMVTSLGAAKTLEHGVLSITPLMSPQAGNGRIYGLAQGLLQLDNPKAKTVARIRQGCRLEEDFKNEFVKDGKITIVLSRSQADFQVAQEVCNAINTISNSTSRNQSSGSSYNGVLAKAIDQVNIEVTIPPYNMADPVDFAAQVMSQPILLENGGRVIINERNGSIVISGDVEIGAVAVTHKNMVINAGDAPAPTGRYAKLETAQKENPKLQNLISALNNLKVSAEDQITIIKGIERDGKLYGMLIIE